MTLFAVRTLLKVIETAQDSGQPQRANYSEVQVFERNKGTQTLDKEGVMTSGNTGPSLTKCQEERQRPWLEKRKAVADGLKGLMV